MVGHEGCPVSSDSSFLQTPTPWAEVLQGMCLPLAQLCREVSAKTAQPFPTARLELELSRF